MKLKFLGQASNIDDLRIGGRIVESEQDSSNLTEAIFDGIDFDAHSKSGKIITP